MNFIKIKILNGIVLKFPYDSTELKIHECNEILRVRIICQENFH